MSVDPAAIYSESYRKLVRVVGHSIDSHDPEDLAGFAFMQFVRYADRLDEDRIFSWLCRVASNEAYARRQRWPSANTGLDRLPDELLPKSLDSDPQRQAESRGQMEAVLALPWRQRNVLVCRMLGLSYDETARASGGKTYTWVNRHIARGHKALQESAA